jgi:hypothetical protein
MLCFCVFTLFSFYTYVPHWYVCLYAVGLGECVSLVIMRVVFFSAVIGIYTGTVCAAIWRKVRVMSRIWGYTSMCQCVCRSCVGYPY